VPHRSVKIGFEARRAGDPNGNSKEQCQRYDQPANDANALTLVHCLHGVESCGDVVVIGAICGLPGFLSLMVSQLGFVAVKAQTLVMVLAERDRASVTFFETAISPAFAVMCVRLAGLARVRGLC